nr:GIY-YIG nuclease superfamily [Ipomoea batatas]
MRRRKSGKDAEKQATLEENPANLTKKRKENWRSKAQIEAIENNRSASSSQEDEELAAQVKEGGSGFFGCYLLTSLSPRFKGCTYIGFTVNPRRRIRQHNGEITSGAWRTKNKRPWEMVLCIYGFPTNVSALQFEWAWQHPKESLAVREAAVSFKAFGGVANKIKMAYTMLTLPAWQRLNLTVNFFSTKYTKHAAGCPILPDHIKVRVCPMDDLPCYSGISWDSCEHDEYDDEECDRIADIEESIEQNATGKTNLTEQMISKKHKWDQGTTRLRDSPSPKENHGHSNLKTLMNAIDKRATLSTAFPEIIDLTDIIGTDVLCNHSLSYHILIYDHIWRFPGSEPMLFLQTTFLEQSRQIKACIMGD